MIAGENCYLRCNLNKKWTGFWQLAANYRSIWLTKYLLYNQCGLYHQLISTSLWAVKSQYPSYKNPIYVVNRLRLSIRETIPSRFFNIYLSSVYIFERFEKNMRKYRNLPYDVTRQPVACSQPENKEQILISSRFVKVRTKQH